MIVEARDGKEANELVRAEAARIAKEREGSESTEVLYFAFIVEVKAHEKDANIKLYDFALAFMKKPNRGALMGAIDLIYAAQATKAADNLWFANAIRDITDPRVDSIDEIYLGLMSALIDEVKYIGASVKKN